MLRIHDAARLGTIGFILEEMDNRAEFLDNILNVELTDCVYADLHDDVRPTQLLVTIALMTSITTGKKYAFTSTFKFKMNIFFL